MIKVWTGHATVNLLAPRVEDINIDDMLRNLSRIVRFNGASCFSVMQHSLWMAEKLRNQGADDATVCFALLHDAHEYITGDIIAPILDGAYVQEGYHAMLTPISQLQTFLSACIYIALHVPKSVLDTWDYSLVWSADNKCREVEEAWILGRPIDDMTAAIIALTPDQAIERFKAELAALGVTI